MSLWNSNLMSSPSGSKVSKPVKATQSAEVCPFLDISITGSGSSLYSCTSNVHVITSLTPSHAFTEALNVSSGAPMNDLVISVGQLGFSGSGSGSAS